MTHKDKITEAAFQQLREILWSCPDFIFEIDENVTDVEAKDKIIVRHPEGDFEIMVVYK